MSEKVILNRSFNNKIKAAKIYIENDVFFADFNNNGKEYQKSINIHELKGCKVINARCPSPTKRRLSLLLEMPAIIFIIVAIAFRKETIKATIFVIIAAIMFIIAALITKMITSKAPEAVEITVYSKDQKIIVLGCNTTAKDYSSVIKRAKECKRINKCIYLDMQTKK